MFYSCYCCIVVVVVVFGTCGVCRTNVIVREIKCGVLVLYAYGGFYKTTFELSYLPSLSLSFIRSFVESFLLAVAAYALYI